MQTGFIGSYTVRLDDKNRFNVPAPFKKCIGELGSACEKVVVRRVSDSEGGGRYIQVYPIGFFNETMSLHYRNLDPLDPATAEKKRAFFSSCFEVEIKSNRLLLPQKLVDFANLKEKERFWVNGMYDYFELWNFDEGEKRFDEA